MMASNRIRPLLADNKEIRTDICVVGAGIAGLIAATRIAAGLNRQVLLLESGQADAEDRQLVELSSVIDPGGRYRGEARARRLGGSSSRWAGKLLTLSESDMAARPYLGLDAWPIDPARLARYTPEIEELMGIDHSSYETLEGYGHSTDGLLPGLEGIKWRWVKRPTRANHRLEHVLRNELGRLNNLTIWTEATVTSLVVREGSLALIGAENHRGGRLKVAADHFVLTAGTLETTRLLLLADATNESCISRNTDALGRYFNDHFGLHPALVRPNSLLWANRMLGDRRINGTQRHLHGELSADWQKMVQAGSAYFDFDPEFGPGTITGRMRGVIKSFGERDAIRTMQHLAKIARNPVAIARELAGRYGPSGRIPWHDDILIRSKVWLEQLPDWRNRLVLSERCDTLGKPMLQVDMRKTAADQRTLAAVLNRLGNWNRELISEVALEWAESSELDAEKTIEQAHPAGSTRMGHHPGRSVVAPSLRTHSLGNVWVASASVFPSSGSANPTLTIMQLAMLVADEISAAYTSVSTVASIKPDVQCTDETKLEQFSRTTPAEANVAKPRPPV